MKTIKMIVSLPLCAVILVAGLSLLAVVVVTNWATETLGSIKC